MCGRYTFYTDKELREVDEIIQHISDDIKREQREKMKTGEIFPTNLVPILIPPQKESDASSTTRVRLQTWGFPNFINKGVIINARSETALQKPMFRGSFDQRRCIIPSTGFIEWDREKRKFLFRLPKEELLYMAGLYNTFEGEDRFVILTTSANDSISDVHDRMPIVLSKQEIEPWLLDRQAVDDVLFGPRPFLERTHDEPEPDQFSFLS